MTTRNAGGCVSRVVYIFRGGREDLLRETIAGDSPDDFLYGLRGFISAGFSHRIVEARAGRIWFAPFVRPFEFLFTKIYGLSMPLGIQLAQLDDLREADVIVATTDSGAFPVMVLKALGIVRGKLIVISQGLYRVREQLIATGIGRWFLRRLRWLCLKAEHYVVLGEGDAVACRGVFAELGGETLEPSIAFFGIDTQFWSPEQERASKGVLSVGSDVLRDYETLCRAVGDLPCRIVTRSKVNAQWRGPNTIVDGDVNYQELRALYRAAEIVVIPVLNKPRDSGHSATLQAMACGKPVILSDTTGLWDREKLRHGENIWLVPPEDPTALRMAIRALLDNPALRERLGFAAREYVMDGHTSTDFGRELVAIARDQGIEDGVVV
jgi:glycosyltransferase involved in cell wall biosynthesis